jgi:hypothetical protein
MFIRRRGCWVDHARFCMATICAVATTAAAARGGDLTLLTGNPAGAPLVITSLANDGQVLVSVVNSTASDPPSDFLTGWQFRLVIQGDPGAVGTLDFGVGSTPPNYVLEAVPHLGPFTAAVSGVFSALDSQFSNPLSGVQVPTSPGANLIAISFLPSVDARGRFGVYAKDGTDSFWLDAANDPNNHPHPYVNTPVGGDLVRIAEVVVTSPADFDRDGDVNGNDLAKWAVDFGRDAGALQTDGDAEADGDVDGGDFLVWQQELGNAAGLAVSGGGVPEPTTGALFGALLWAMILRRSVGSPH